MDTEHETPFVVEYPLRKDSADSVWNDKAFRREWNRKYREEIREGKRQPHRSNRPSKWNDKEFRKAYDEARKKKKAEERTELRVNPETAPEKRPNYSKKEKQMILDRILEAMRGGTTFEHPHFQIGLVTRTEAKRTYPEHSRRRPSQPQDKTD